MHFCIRIVLIILLITFLLYVSCSKEQYNSGVSKQVLNRSLSYSNYTDPGEFEYLYENLPESINDICNLIKIQLIHPFEIKKYGDKIPKDREYEDRSFSTVEQMLNELFERDANGLVDLRLPEKRLVVACIHHSLLLASILRHKGIPVRLRAGNAKYIGDDKNYHVTHVICEAWDTHRKKWYLVDPDRNKIDFSRQEFEFASETWQKLRNGNIDKRYYISRYKSVEQATAHLIWLDLSYIVRDEEPYWNDPPVVTKIKDSINDISNAELQLLDNISTLLRNPEKYMDELIFIKTENKSLVYNEES